MAFKYVSVWKKSVLQTLSQSFEVFLQLSDLPIPLFSYVCLQHNAQKRAERQYIEALRSAGLDEGFLERKSRQAKGGRAAQEDRPLRNDSESDEDLDILQRTSEVNDTYEVDQMSNGTFSSEEDNSSVAQGYLTCTFLSY